MSVGIAGRSTLTLICLVGQSTLSMRSRPCIDAAFNASTRDSCGGLGGQTSRNSGVLSPSTSDPSRCTERWDAHFKERCWRVRSPVDFVQSRAFSDGHISSEWLLQTHRSTSAGSPRLSHFEAWESWVLTGAVNYFHSPFVFAPTFPRRGCHIVLCSALPVPYSANNSHLPYPNRWQTLLQLRLT
jgi:hypothetical protein